MIGQKNNLNTVIQWRINKSIPRFIIIFGEEGSGRLTLAKVIMKCLNAYGIIAGNSINDVRETIENAYTISDPTFYIFRNADDMRQEAKNALLKVVEEPPNNAYFIMTVQNIDSMLGTIRSRGTVIKMEPYSQEDITSVCTDELLLRYARNISDTQIDRNNVQAVVTCVKEIIDALENKSGTKLLKSCVKLKSKKSDTDKIDCSLFLRIFMHEIISFQNLITFDSIRAISKCEEELKRNTISKKSSVECMLISILEVLKNAKIS